MGRKAVFIIIYLLLTITLVWFLVKQFESEEPGIIPNQEIKFLNKQRILNFRIEDLKSGLRNVNAALLQEGFQKEIFAQNFYGSFLWSKKNINFRDIQINLDPVEMKLKEGPVTIVIKVHDYSWRNKFTGNVTVLQQSFIIDKTPPHLYCLSTQHYINQGGTGVVVYQTSDDSVKSGVQAGKLFFPGFPVESSTKPGAYLAYFAVPYDQRELAIELRSVDEAGNESMSGFHYFIREKSFRHDQMNVSDTFLQRKIPQFFTLDETLRGESLIDSFLKVNHQLRKANNQRIQEICKQSVPERLWEGEFLRLRNAETSALFADHRTYLYQGKKVDEQVHLGIDLASIAHSPVAAANHGLITFQGELGIYGKTIVMDHGQNIFSMYSHLSTFNIAAGQKVNKGDIIGTTGDTGLAGGDHLHFAMLIGGIFINPLEWWDRHWIDDNITLKISLVK